MNPIKTIIGMYALFGIAWLVYNVNPPEIAHYLEQAFQGNTPTKKPEIIERVKEGDLVNIIKNFHLIGEKNE